MYSKISIKNEKELVLIDIEGTIGIPEECQFEHPDQRVATYEKFRSEVQRIQAIESSHIVVNIRSTGGDVNDAMLIYDALRSTGAEITTRCFGYTASAATIIAQAASKGCREIAPGALYLIHNSICVAEGNSEELEAQLDMLRKTDERIAQIYALSSSRPAEEFRALMAENSGHGRWLSPEETLQLSLADKIVESIYPSEPTTEQEDDVVAPQNHESGWRRLLNALSPNKSRNKEQPLSTPKAERNLLHPQLEHRSLVAVHEAQSKVCSTTIQSIEDPSPRDDVRSLNTQAYDEDMRRIRIK